MRGPRGRMVGLAAVLAMVAAGSAQGHEVAGLGGAGAVASLSLSGGNAGAASNMAVVGRNTLGGRG